MYSLIYQSLLVTIMIHEHFNSCHISTYNIVLTYCCGITSY